MRLRFIKQKSIFLIGFTIGFVFSLLLFSLKNIFVANLLYNQEIWQTQYDLNEKLHDKRIILQLWKKEELTTKHFNSVTYNAWLAAQNLKLYEVELDKYIYGPKENGTIEKRGNMEWNWLKEQVFITCVIFVEKLKLGKSIRATWGRQCSNIYFFGHRLKDTELPIINVGTKIISSWQLLCEAMNYIWNNKTVDNLEWIIFAKDDTVVIPENLRYIVAPLSYYHDYYLGHPIVMWGQAYNVAQSGYVLSKGALAKIVKIFNNTEKCAAGGKYWKKEDYYLGKHLSSLGIHPSDTRDQYLRSTFHGYSLQNLLWGVVKPDSYWTRALYPQKACCSPMSVTFTASEPDKMYLLNYLLYHLRVFTNESRFGNVPAAVPIPEENVWKIALKEEFNITHLSDISSDAYYEMWHAKYSEPGQLITKNEQKMSDALNCLLASYNLENISTNNFKNRKAPTISKN